MFEAMIYILRTGCPWRDMPPDFGPWGSVYTRWQRWCKAGVWTKLLHALKKNARGRLRFLDASHIKVHQDAANPSGGQQNQAIGRTKGGLNTKLTAVVDVRGHAISLSLAPGNAADVKVAEGSLGAIKLRTVIVVADKGYDSDPFRQQLSARGAQSSIPPRANRLKPTSWNRAYYRLRHRVENYFQRIKRLRRVGTRYEKTDAHYLGFVHLATILDWVRN